MKSLEKILLGIASFSLLTAQELSPPAFLEAFPYDGGVELYWVQTFSFGDVLLENFHVR